MCLGKFCLLFLLSSQANISQLGVDARPITVPNQERYVKVFESLGMMCECCDGAGGECKNKWNSPCSNLKCRPWKFL